MRPAGFGKYVGCEPGSPARLRRLKEAQNLAHQALSLARREDALRVRRAIEDHELFRASGPFILFSDFGQSRFVVADDVVAARPPPRNRWPRDLDSDPVVKLAAEALARAISTTAKRLLLHRAHDSRGCFSLRTHNSFHDSPLPLPVVGCTVLITQRTGQVQRIFWQQRQVA